MSSRYPVSDLKLLLCKGVILFEYLDSFDKFDDYELPHREKCFSTLRGEECFQENYDLAQSVLTAFGCATLYHYLKLYLGNDVYQLANVFQNFRRICYQNYELDPAYFVLAPQLAWNSMCKIQNLQLELSSDVEMYWIIQPNIHKGICYASGRYAGANNKCMVALYQPDKTELFIMSIDATKSYGLEMSQALLFSDFKLLSNAQLPEAKIALTSDDLLRTVRYFDSKVRYICDLASIVNADGFLDPQAETNFKHDTAYICEIDRKYPVNIHDRDDYLLVPELLEIKT